MKVSNWVDDKDAFKDKYTENLENEIIELRKEIAILKGTYRGDEWRIEQYNRNRSIDNQVSTIKEMEEAIEKSFQTEYIYERNPDTNQLYRRKLGDYDNREQIDSDGNPLPTQMELF